MAKTESQLADILDKLGAIERRLDVLESHDLQLVGEREWRATVKRSLEQEAEHAKREPAPPRDWIRAICAPGIGQLTWSEVDLEDDVERSRSLVGNGGYHLALESDWKARIARSPNLAALVADGQLVVAPLTTEEARAHERRIALSESAMPPSLRGAAPGTMPAQSFPLGRSRGGL